MEFLGIIVTIVIVILLSAAKKKKPQKEEGNNAPPRPATMSDIQRAFMMLSDQEDAPQNRPAQPAPQKPVQPMPQKQPTLSAYEGTAGLEGAPGSEGLSGSEGLPGSEGISGIEGTASREGMGTEGLYKPEIVQTIPPHIRRPDRISDADPGISAIRRRTARSSLKLFADKNEIVKAVVYAEILSRRTQRR